jgi:uncharacterized membrane protein
MNDDDLVAGYLGRLVQAARQLPPDRRSELIDEIADHIEQARAVSEASGPDLRDLLRRLGEPEAIAAAASDSPGDFSTSLAQPASSAAEVSAVRGPRRRWVDLAAVLLTLGSVLLSPISFVLALLGWAVGNVMLFLSPRWPRRAKILGAVTGTLALVIFGGLLASVAKAWNLANGQQPTHPFGWQAGGGPFVSAILATGAVVAVTLVGARLLRYPPSQPAGPGPAMRDGPAVKGPASASGPKPTASARAS